MLLQVHLEHASPRPRNLPCLISAGVETNPERTGEAPLIIKTQVIQPEQAARPPNVTVSTKKQPKDDEVDERC